MTKGPSDPRTASRAVAEFSWECGREHIAGCADAKSARDVTPALCTEIDGDCGRRTREDRSDLKEQKQSVNHRDLKADDRENAI
jgi:hypothetical protein